MLLMTEMTRILTFFLHRLQRLPNQRWTNWWQATRWERQDYEVCVIFIFRLPLALDQPGQMLTSSNSSSNKATRRSTLSSEQAAVHWDRTLLRVRFWDEMMLVDMKARHPAVLWRLKSKTSVRFEFLLKQMWWLHASGLNCKVGLMNGQI